MMNKDGGGGQFLDFMGGHSCYEGDIELMGVPQSPTRENPAHILQGHEYVERPNSLGRGDT